MRLLGRITISAFGAFWVHVGAVLVHMFSLSRIYIYIYIFRFVLPIGGNVKENIFCHSKEQNEGLLFERGREKGGSNQKEMR